MAEIWEETFKEKQSMWGFEPSDSAILASDFFKEKGFKDILIPGFGYGRNGKIFLDKNMNVTGIEISETAVKLAKEHYGNGMKIFNRSVTEMPFEKKLYDGIFCYALIHLLNKNERRKLIIDCFAQLKINGYMIFVAISKKAPTYATGKKLSKDRFEIFSGIKMFFYDSESISSEFGKYGLVDYHEIDEPVKNMINKPPQKFWFIKCRKE